MIERDDIVELNKRDICVTFAQPISIRLEESVVLSVCSQMALARKKID